MCVVSLVSDHYYDKWDRYPKQQPPWNEPIDWSKLPPFTPAPSSPITQEEIDEFRKLLERARKYDKDNHEPECELQEKKDKLTELAKKLGVKISFG